ncbi:HAMP domain-containing sensor histidine kinase [Ruegeria sp. PrR005]|uniref:histidine kinase n=1 Tax=Ruegeria sp. PrR005 TaxID=2706882 RepID=A0A6B2NRJ9_9RHOB|nr:HAMP domain-containing sensor histidine kinase [Ruegeria sp. PrR005]NDW46786.1 HAMP domain-containing histidine kinase [Ruegeria sp. PrR005]
MRHVLAILKAPVGAAGSLQRKLTVNILAALLLTILMSVTVLIFEFFEHLEENQEEALYGEAKEILVQIDPDLPGLGFDPQALRFRGVEGAYRYTIFGPAGHAVVGGEDMATLRAQIAQLALGQAAEIAVPNARRGVALCGLIKAERYCVLASAYLPSTDRPVLDTMWHEVQEQTQWILLGSLIVFAAAVGAVRLSLSSLDKVRREALEIGPDAPDGRLSADDLPAELVPLAQAVNTAFARLQQGYKAQRAFAANVAHEVRTPLAVLHSSVDTIHDAALRESLKPDVTRLEAIFEQLVDLARADALMPEAFSKVELCKLARQVSGARAMAALKAGKMLAVTGADTATVAGHEGLLAIALDNLVRNALAHAPAGSEVEIDVRDNPPVLRVQDRGPGVAAEDRDAIFEPFHRGRRPSGDGSGIGLAIVRAVAAAHGADVQVEDRPGGGSVFSIAFR